MTSIVFSSCASYSETQRRTSSSIHYLSFQKQGLVVWLVFKTVICITHVRKKAFGKWNAEAQPIQVYIYVPVCLKDGDNISKWILMPRLELRCSFQTQDSETSSIYSILRDAWKSSALDAVVMLIVHISVCWWMFMDTLDMIETDKLQPKQQKLLNQRHVKAHEIRVLQQMPVLTEWSLQLQEW